MLLSNKENYLNFEYYCINKHIIDTNNETYHWSKIPDKILIDSGYFENEEELRQRRKNKNGVLQEYGIDAISIRKNNNNENIYNPLQMKLWKNTICANDLGTFMSVYYNRFYNLSKESKGYIYHISKLENTFYKDIQKTNNIISIKLDNPFIINDEKKDIILRPYQLEALEELKKGWEGIGSLILPCGTGKTIIFCEYLKYIKPKNIFIFSPLKFLTEQNLEITKKYLSEYNNLLVDSDGSTNFIDIKNLLNKNTIFSCTYKTAKNILFNLFDENIIMNDSILIIDEAHNLLNSKLLIKLIKKFPKVLLITATPPNQMNEILNSKIIYKYLLSKAIEEKYICDYKLYFPFIENNKIMIDIPDELYNLDENICKKCLFFINGLLRTGSRKTILYLKSSAEIDIYTKTINNIMLNYHYYKCEIFNIIFDTNNNDRKMILKKFQQDEYYEVIKIILSVRILDEGIDIPKCDSIFITHIGNVSNDIRNTQRILRANRLDNNNKNKIANIFIWCDDSNKSINTIKLLKNNDIKFNKKVIINNDNYGYYNKNNINNNEIIIKKNNDIIEFININCYTEDEIEDIKIELLINFFNENKRIITENEIYKNYNLGNWYYSQLKKIKNNLDKNNKIIEKLNKYDIFKEDIIKYLNEKIEKNRSYYKCFKCDYKKDLFRDMKNHININKVCNKDSRCNELSNDEILIRTLIPYIKDKQTVNFEKIKYYNYTHINRNILLDILFNIDKQKIKLCKFCNTNFSKIQELKQHIIMECFENEMKKINEDKLLY